MKQTKEPESSSNISLAGNGPLILPDFIRQARQAPTEPSGPAFDWLAFFKKFNVRPKDLLKARKTAPKPAKVTRLASGLTIEKTLEIVDALETALANFKSGEKLFPCLNPSQIWLKQTASGLEIQLPGNDSEINRQRELTRLLYMLVTGQELAAKHPASQLDALVYQYPHTVNVLRQGWQDGYTSTRQLCGAFGWSLFRWENLPLTDEQIEVARLKMAERPKKEVAPKQLDLPSAEVKPANRSGFPGILAVGSLLIGLVLIVTFLVFSFANPPAPPPKPTVAPTATIISSPTAPTGLQNTRQADGVNVTRLNSAYLSQNEPKYTGPDALVSGQAVKLNSQRYIRAVNAEWSLGQNIYLTLQDGGWEVWDTISGTRISRRELADSDQYAWVSWSPDGENFAAEGLDGKMRLGTGGRVLRTFNYAWNGYNPGDPNFQGSWSPDSSILMLANNDGFNQFQFWNFKGTPQLIQGPTDKAGIDLKADAGKNSLSNPNWSWSGDSRYIAFYLSNGLNLVNIYDSHTLQRVGSISTDWQIQLPAGNAFVDSYSNTSTQGNFAWSPDGKYMALQRWIKGTGGENGVYKRILFVWEAPSMTGICRDSCPVLPATYQEISLTTPFGTGLLAWSRSDRLLVNNRQVETVNNQQVVTSNSLQVYDLNQGNGFNWNQTYSQVLADTPDSVNAWWATDGRRVLVSDDQGYLAIFDTTTRNISVKTNNIQVLAQPVQNPVETALNLPGPTPQKNIAPSPDGRWLATFSQQNGPQLRDLTTGQVAFMLDNFTVNANITYKWSADSRYLAVIYSWADGTSFNPHTKTVARIWKFDQHSGKPGLLGDILIPTKIDFAPRVDWNSQSDTPQLLYEMDQNSVGVLDISKGITGTITLTNPTKTPATMSGAVSLTPTAAPSGTSGDTMVYVGTYNGTPPVSIGDVVRVVVVSTATPLTMTPANPTGTANPTSTTNPFGSLSPRSTISQFFTVPREWAADWSFLVGPLDTTRNFGILRLLPEKYDGELIKVNFQPSTEVKPEKAIIRAVAISPDKRMVALGFDNGLVQLYNAADGKLFQAFSAHTAAITALSFSPDSKSLATGAMDHTVKIWETTNWKTTAMLRGQTSAISFLQWFPDSKILLAATNEPNSAVMWRVQ